MVAGPQEVGNFSYLVLEPQHLKVEGKISNQEGPKPSPGWSYAWKLHLTGLMECGLKWGWESDFFFFNLGFPPRFKWKVELFARLQTFSFSQLLFPEMLCWFSHGGLVYVPEIVSLQYFLYRVSIQCVQITMGLETGHLPSGTSRTQLPLQVQSTECLMQRH